MLQETQWIDTVELRFNEDGTPVEAVNIRYIHAIKRDGVDVTRTYVREVVTRDDDLSRRPAALQNILGEFWSDARTDAHMLDTDS